MPVICVDNPFTTRIQRRYYCTFCYEELVRRAAQDVPALENGATDEQNVQQVKVLLGVDPGRVERKSSTPVMDLNLDIKVAWPAALLNDRVPFAHFYPRGKALEAHKAAVHCWLYGDD